MINASEQLVENVKVIDGVEFVDGKVNVSDGVLLANVRHAIRLPYPQVRPQAPNYERVVLVGGGPSLKDTEPELVELIREGAQLVTMNGAYHWALEHNLRPQSQIVMDARPENARFLQPAVPRCNYLLASQCAPETWAAVQGRSNVWIFHAASGTDNELKRLLDAYYLDQWFGVGGGVTVASRAISLLRTLGYLRFDLFGVDSCWMDGQHHAFPQIENERDRRVGVTVELLDGSGQQKTFTCSPWHVKQFEDFLQIIRINGHHFQLNVHGEGMLAYALRASAGMEWQINKE